MASDRITLYGANWCPDCRRAKQFLGEQRVHYDFVDVDGNAAATAYVEQVNDGKTIIPTIVFPDGSVLVEPSNAELATKLGVRSEAARRFYDLIVIGSGPAGLTAALYAAREGIDTLVIERGGVGGQAGITERLDNFPGFPEGISGNEFANRLRAQAERFGVEILGAQQVRSIAVDGDYRVVTTADGNEYRAYALLLATGSTYRRLGLERENDFIGAGVHFCATCDGPFYRDRDVAVVGGGNSAGEESLFLTRFARHVTIITRDDKLTASRVVVDKVTEHPEIDVIYGAEIASFTGGDHVEGVVVRDRASGDERKLDAAGVFVFIGLKPNAELVSDLVMVDSAGFVVADAGMQTSVPGVFVAGDVRSGSTKQAASAAGEGAAAAIAIRRYLEPFPTGMPSRIAEMAVTA